MEMEESKSKHNNFGTDSMILGIIELILIWIAFFPPNSADVVWFVFHLPLGILAVILGYIG